MLLNMANVRPIVPSAKRSLRAGCKDGDWLAISSAFYRKIGAFHIDLQCDFIGD